MSLVLKNSDLSYSNTIILLRYIDDLTTAFNQLNSDNKELLKDYYKENIEFFYSVIEGKRKIDAFTCLQSAKASVDYLKLFL